MPARRGAHDADAVGIQPVCGGLVPDDAHGPLEILPGTGMLGQPFGPRRAVFHGHYRDAQCVEVAPGGGHFKAFRSVAHVGSARVDDLDGIGRALHGDVPLQVRRALVWLCVRHPALRPEVFLAVHRRDQVFGIAVRQGDFRFRRPQEAHLPHEFYTALKAEGSVSLSRIQMQFGRDAHPAQLPVNQC